MLGVAVIERKELRDLALGRVRQPCLGDLSDNGMAFRPPRSRMPAEQDRLDPAWTVGDPFGGVTKPGGGEYGSGSMDCIAGSSNDRGRPVFRPTPPRSGAMGDLSTLRGTASCQPNSGRMDLQEMRMQGG